MIWFRILKGMFILLVLVGLRSLFESDPTLTLPFREVGGILVLVGGIGYVLARGALGFTRRRTEQIDEAGPPN
jgi:hypothetical protein